MPLVSATTDLAIIAQWALEENRVLLAHLGEVIEQSLFRSLPFEDLFVMTPAMRVVDRVPYPIRRDLRRFGSALGVQVEKAQPWKWERTLLAAPTSGQRALYVGTRARRLELSRVLGEWLDMPAGSASNEVGSDDTAVVSELPMPGAIRVPWQLTARVDMAGPFDLVRSSFSSRVLRNAERRLADFRVRQVTQLDEALEISRTMLEPFAAARHGDATHHTPREQVLRLALSGLGGYLHVLEDRGVAVGCNLAQTYTEHGQRVFEGLRLGYVEAVFSDPNRLSEVNTTNLYCMMKEAWTRGFTCYDLGPTAANPRDGQLIWKCRRGGQLSLKGNYGYFFLKLPRAAAAAFLWETPLLSVMRGGLRLELGLPAEATDNDMIRHHAVLSGVDVQLVRVHCARPPGAELMHALSEKFSAETQAIHVASRASGQVTPPTRRVARAPQPSNRT